MAFSMYNGLNDCTLGNVTMYQKSTLFNEHINQIVFDFNNAMTKFQHINNVPQVLYKSFVSYILWPDK